jgi:hypothetical protein
MSVDTQSMAGPRPPSSQPVVPTSLPTAGSEAWRKGRKWLLLILALMVGLVGLAFLQGSGEEVEETTDLLVAAAPFIVVATALERFWEALFDWYERFALATANLAGVSAQTTAWMKTEVQNAEITVTEAAQALGVLAPGNPEYPRLWQQFQEAETRLLDAKTRITEILKTPEYVSIKRAVILIGSLIMGVSISIGAKLMLLQTLGFPVPAPADMVLTGLLIGSGPGPLHSLIGTLSEFRGIAGGLAELTRGNAVKSVKETLPQVTTPRMERPAAPAVDVTIAAAGRPVAGRVRTVPGSATAPNALNGGNPDASLTEASANVAPALEAEQFQLASDNLRACRQTERILRPR